MKRLGQHFLKNRRKLKEIAASLDLKEGDVVVEIGAGHGELTRELIAVPNVKVIAIEKDKSLVLKLKENFKSPELEIVEGDALKVLPSLIRNLELEIRNSSYKVAGNIPFYITGRLLRILGDLITGGILKYTTLMVFTVQKEVAERICAAPPKMNLLAASVQFWAKPEIIGSIPKKDFSPPPEVDAVIVKLTTKYQQLKTENYYKLIKILFRQPRKTVLNNLAAGLKSNKKEITEKLKKLKINPEDRAQNLSVDEILKLSRELKTENASDPR
ncbi:MAG: ribosomal RNA small subunit methyltransferase A [Candidatus Brennerbacteria bacterium]|nr:ribosomal RNA small subunit methyltransferase A [Candidatus Brennerbacteria bacterium]